MEHAAPRIWMVRWLYLLALLHLLAGLALPWVGGLALFEPYHRAVESGFWTTAPAAARAQQVWWTALFGPTLQAMALFMLALVRIGDVQRSRFAWGVLLAGMLLWGPQDMLVSMRAGAAVHVWIDCAALILLLPPLLWLWRHDKPREAV